MVNDLNKYKVTVYSTAFIEVDGYLIVKARDINHASEQVREKGFTVLNIIQCG